eukprot:CAMPEP_0114550950 /NCGR_PEP_ID=MMETSP0114-20121206/6345_1 /TAXON_ID=31324 /ORGANISM="Goniomonas sp, Strain m" /LENGTH=45 /DNA_ID= /DNA_START= /DNA_END= /DNA_ORIENTATION=
MPTAMKYGTYEYQNASCERLSNSLGSVTSPGAGSPYGQTPSPTCR